MAVAYRPSFRQTKPEAILVVKIKCGAGNPETPMNAAFLALYATFFPWPHFQ